MTPDQVLKLAKDTRAEAEEFDTLKRLYTDALLQRALSSEAKDSLVKLRGLALAQLMYDELMERLEIMVKTVAEKHKELTETIIPSLMDELGVPNLSISETQALGIKLNITANIPKARIEEGCKWLEENKFGAIIKQVVSTEFGTKEGEKAAKVVEAIKALELGIEPSVKKSVNHMTLGALVREQLEAGTELPFELLGIYRRRSSVVSTKKN